METERKKNIQTEYKRIITWNLHLLVNVTKRSTN